MNKLPKYPSLYQVNTRVWLTELSHELGRKATLDDIPDAELDHLAGMGFDWIWFLSVWKTGKLGQKISRETQKLRKDFEDTLPDLKEKDIEGSGFAIASYTVSENPGGDEALARLRKRLKKRGMKLMLDFVPNHMGPDHPWVKTHPDYFVSGTEDDLEKYPQNYTRIKKKNGDLILAYGRDPYFDGWSDTLQLDYSNPATVEAMKGELQRIASQCDGVRCDMAMLLIPEVFEKTWGRRAQIFWPIATKAVREKHPGFCFMAEVYWDMEWRLQQQGFDYAYDKRLYDRLVEGHVKAIREHFYAGLDYQDKLARFLENHDEPRAASTFEQKKHETAAIITFLSPGLRFFHQGQFEGRKKHISPHLVRGPKEPAEPEIQDFYAKLLSVVKYPVFRDGNWRLLECKPEWEGNGSWDAFIAFSWEGKGDEKSVICINYASHASQCFVQLPFEDMTDKLIILKDMMSPAVYEREGSDVLSRGLYLDLPAWGYHVFEIGYTVKSK